MNKKVVLTAIAITVIGAGTFAANQTFAQSTTDSGNPMTSIVKQIADKFGLKQANVQAVFDANRKDMGMQRKANVEQRLSQAVTDGKITEAQKQLILTKHAELESSRQTHMQDKQSMTMEERKTAKVKERSELEAWAKSNNIDLQYLMPGHGMKGHGGPGMDGPPRTSTAQ